MYNIYIYIDKHMINMYIICIYYVLLWTPATVFRLTWSIQDNTKFEANPLRLDSKDTYDLRGPAEVSAKQNGFPSPNEGRGVSWWSFGQRETTGGLYEALISFIGHCRWTSRMWGCCNMQEPCKLFKQGPLWLGTCGKERRSKESPTSFTPFVVFQEKCFWCWARFPTVSLCHLFG